MNFRSLRGKNTYHAGFRVLKGMGRKKLTRIIVKPCGVKKREKTKGPSEVWRPGNQKTITEKVEEVAILSMKENITGIPRKPGR